MKLEDLNLSLYLNGKVEVTIDNKKYISEGNLIGFEIKSLPLNELFLFTEIHNGLPPKSGYVIFKQQSKDKVYFNYNNGLSYRVVGIDSNSIILTDETIEYFITPIGI